MTDSTKARIAKVQAAQTKARRALWEARREVNAAISADDTTQHQRNLLTELYNDLWDATTKLEKSADSATRAAKARW